MMNHESGIWWSCWVKHGQEGFWWSCWVKHCEEGFIPRAPHHPCCGCLCTNVLLTLLQLLQLLQLWHKACPIAQCQVPGSGMLPFQSQAERRTPVIMS